jgi:hypothetical protein
MYKNPWAKDAAAVQEIANPLTVYNKAGIWSPVAWSLPESRRILSWTSNENGVKIQQWLSSWNAARRLVIQRASFSQPGQLGG